MLFKLGLVVNNSNRVRIIKRIIVFAVCIMFILSSCGERNSIHVISREAGSGTRSTFAENFSLINENGYDLTRVDADINDSTGVMLANVSSDVNAIGYASIAALSDRVKAVAIDGVSPTAENVVSKRYKASRALLVVVRPDISKEAYDFISYILSSQGQNIVNNAGYVSVQSDRMYEKSDLSGEVLVAGSSSVAPVIERLAEQYESISGIDIELQQSDSSSGIRSLTEGICDMGLCSRDLSEEELSFGLIPYEIAYDALAVIVNPQNPVAELSSKQVNAIYKGDIKYWYEVVNGKIS